MVAFKNLGNTCYFNVVLQILLHLKTPTKRKLSLDSEKHANWCKILQKLQNLKKHKVFNPKLLFDFLDWDTYFSRGRPHDAHEALLKIIELIGYSCFQGRMLDVMITSDEPYEHHCKNTEFTTIDLTVSQPTIEDCFLDYFRTDIIRDWKDKENNNRNLIKFSNILKFPDNLIILLKQGYNKKQKLIYNRTLNMSVYSASPEETVEYNLNSIVIHRREHYYIYCIENKNNWYMYSDDERDPIPCTSKWVPNEAPYMLVYSKM